jgi:hypothetical protein
VKTFEIVLQNEKTKEKKKVVESGWDADDMIGVLSDKYGKDYILVSIKPMVNTDWLQYIEQEKV